MTNLLCSLHLRRVSEQGADRDILFGSITIYPSDMPTLNNGLDDTDLSASLRNIDDVEWKYLNVVGIG